MTTCQACGEREGAHRDATDPPRPAGTECHGESAPLAAPDAAVEECTVQGGRDEEEAAV